MNEPIVSLGTYTTVVRIVAPVLAILFWVLAWLFRNLSRQGSNDGRRLDVTGWTAHLALFWTANGAARWYYGNEVPPYLFGIWIMIVSAHIGVSLLWTIWVLRRYPTPKVGPEIPEGWEGINDD